RPFPSPQVVLSSGSTGTTAASDAHPASHPLPGSPVIGRYAPAASAGCRAGKGLPRLAWPSPRFREARHSLSQAEGETPNDAAGFASCYGPHRRSPIQRLSTLGGLRRQAATLSSLDRAG